MANLKDSSKFAVHDNYYTPKIAWEQINNLIPKDKIIWECFCLGAEKSKSPEYLEELGNKVVVDRTMNMLRDQPDNWDMIVSNPPFDKTYKLPALVRLVELNKPFILVMNSLNTYTKYFREIFAGKLNELQIITPDNKINFDKLEDTGELVQTSKCSFYSVYVCYKMNLTTEQLWITTPSKPKMSGR